MVAAAVFRQRLLAFRAGLGLAAGALFFKHFVELLVGLRVLDRPLVVLFLVLLPLLFLGHHICAGTVVGRSDLRELFER